MSCSMRSETGYSQCRAVVTGLFAGLPPFKFAPAVQNSPSSLSSQVQMRLHASSMYDGKQEPLNKRLVRSRRSGPVQPKRPSPHLLLPASLLLIHFLLREAHSNVYAFSGTLVMNYGAPTGAGRGDRLISYCVRLISNYHRT